MYTIQLSLGLYYLFGLGGVERNLPVSDLATGSESCVLYALLLASTGVAAEGGVSCCLSPYRKGT